MRYILEVSGSGARRLIMDGVLPSTPRSFPSQCRGWLDRGDFVRKARVVGTEDIVIDLVGHSTCRSGVQEDQERGLETGELTRQQ
jgi:hypothetical protein